MRNYFVKAPHSKEKHCVKHMILTRDTIDTILFGVTKHVSFWISVYSYHGHFDSLRIQTNLLILHFHHKDQRFHWPKQRTKNKHTCQGGWHIFYYNQPCIWTGIEILKLGIGNTIMSQHYFNLIYIECSPFQIFRSIIFSKDSYSLHSRIGSAIFSQFQ